MRKDATVNKPLTMRSTLKILFTQFAGASLLLWWAGAFVATHMPLTEGTRGLPYVDKVTHVFLYAGLAFLLANWRATRGAVGKQEIARVIIILLIYTAIDETLQQFVGRTPDFKDAAANLIGMFLGLTLFHVSTRR